MQGRGTASSNEEMKPTIVPPHNREKCPRCESFNTKFCYYNNYSLSQPRYFCKSCRRYWTQGGTLRNVPIGGGSRKGKRPKAIIIPSSAALQPSPETQITPPSVPAETGLVFGGYLPPSMEMIQSLNQTAQILNQSVDHVTDVDVGVLSSFGSEQNWPHRSFGDHHHNNPVWTTLNDTTNNSSSSGNDKNLSTENNCLVPINHHHHHHLPGYNHSP